MSLRKKITLFSVCICSVVLSTSSLSSEVKSFNPNYNHFATPPKLVETKKSLRLPKQPVPVKKSSSQKKQSNSLHSLKPSSTSANNCTVDNLYLLAGDTLINYIVSCTHSDIIQQPFFEENSQTLQLYSGENMMSLAGAIEARSATYNSEKRQGLAELMLIARAGFYNAFYSDSLNYPLVVNATFNDATQAFSDNANFLDISDEHGVVLSEWINLVDGSENWITAYDDLFAILDRYPTQSVEETISDAIQPLYDVQNAILRGQNNNVEFSELINSDEQMVSRYVRLANDMYSYMGTDYEGAFTNLLLGLGSLLEQSNHVESAKIAITVLLKEYSRLSPEFLKLVQQINYFGDCTQFEDVCREVVVPEVMSIAFPNTYTFDDGNLIINTAIGMNKAQALYHAQKQVEAQFKRKSQELDALASDENEVLTMFVYGSRAAYEQFQPFLFELDTDNGGMYIESWGQFFTYERTPQESIYSLEELFRHEYVHYLHGRYTIEGLWGETEMYKNNRLTWFEEGGAEFFAGSTQADDVELRKIMIQNIDWDDGEHMSVSEIVNASYASGFKFYRYSALFFNFLNDTQPQTITDLHKIISSDDVTAFDAVVSNFIHDAQLQSDYAEYLVTKIAVINSMSNFTPTSYTAPTHLDTDLLENIQSEITTVDVFSSSRCESIATTLNARFSCSGTVTGVDYANINTKIDAGIKSLNGVLNNFNTMNCSIGSVKTGDGTVSAPYSCEGGLREHGTDQMMNQAPQANAGEDMAVGILEIVDITGFTSTDPEGDVLTYSWVQTGGEPVENVSALSGFDEMTLSFYTYEEYDGTELVFELTVSDGEYTSTDSVVVTVGIIPNNQAPTADAGIEQTVNEGSTVTLNATGTDTDGDSLTITWKQTGGTAVTIANDQFTAPNVSATETLTFEVTVSDGHLSDTDIVTITVNNVAVATNPPTKSTTKESSGGSISWLGVFFISLVSFRKKFKSKVNCCQN